MNKIMMSFMALAAMIFSFALPAMAATDTELSNTTGISYVKDSLIPAAFTVLLTPPVNMFAAVLLIFLAIVLLVKVIRRMG